MRHINFDPLELEGEDLEWFNSWLDRAGAAAQLNDSLAVGAQPTFRATVWGELKTWLLDHVFAGKCAYCETQYDAGSYGAAEHYRPKGRVSERSPSGKFAPVSANNQPHRGYYWLAYKWWNLVPSCDKCNSGQGKRDQFPVNAIRIFEKTELTDSSAREEINAKEGPLLLNPYDDDPAEHLVFGKFGVVASREGSPRGWATIEVCKLMRDPLKERRAERQEFATSALRLALSEWFQSDCDDRHLDDFRKRFMEPTREYSAAAEVTYDDLLSGMRRLLAEV